MKIAVLFASNRHGGKHEEIRKMIDSIDVPFEFDFIELADYNISHCKQDCISCVIKTEHRCLLDNDTETIMKKLTCADINMIIVPIYFPYPSKFIALMEKLLNSCYRIENRPLKDKPTALFLYCSVKIVDESQLKILWQQYLMDGGYSFTKVNYPYLNETFHDRLNAKYNDNITEYIKDFLLNLKYEAKVDSRCGLHCTGCEYKESHGCGGCIETNGHPFHGECPVAKCCQDKGFTHCGECPDIPEKCSETDCKKVDENGFHLCDGCGMTNCGKLHAYSYTDPEHGDNPPGKRIEQCKRWAKI
jgi:multimeric flavodoxin WrbA